MSRTLVSFVFATLLAAVPAQTHSVSMVSNASGSTIVTFEVRGPARSVAVVFASTGTTDGIPLPPFGTLYLDPATGLVELFTFAIGPNGVGTVSLTLPTQLLDGVMLATQAAIVSGGSVSLSSWCGLGLTSTPLDVPTGAGGTYNKETQTATVTAYGPAGQTVKIWEKEGNHVVLRWQGQMPPDGKVTTVIGNLDLRDGDSVLVEVGTEEFELKW